MADAPTQYDPSEAGPLISALGRKFFGRTAQISSEQEEQDAVAAVQSHGTVTFRAYRHRVLPWLIGVCIFPAPHGPHN
jgi:hypothetical protein